MSIFGKTIILSIVSITMGCVTADNSVKLEAVVQDMVQVQHLSSLQIKKLLLGHTYPLSKGEIYFSSPSKAILIQSGVIESTNWYATDDSSFCFNIKGSENCISITSTEDGNYIQKYKGEKKFIAADKIVKGKVFYNYFR